MTAHAANVGHQSVELGAKTAYGLQAHPWVPQGKARLGDHLQHHPLQVSCASYLYGSLMAKDTVWNVYNYGCMYMHRVNLRLPPMASSPVSYAQVSKDLARDTSHIALQLP